MNFAKLRVLLHNVYVQVVYWFSREKCCGLFENPDGRLVECDKWWGYQNCMYPGCGHYQIEHSDGTPNKVIYAKDQPELVGTEFTTPKGCMNAGCDMCPEFWDEAKLHGFVQDLSYARNHASHTFNLEECPGVIDTYARVVTVIEVDVTMRYPSTTQEYTTMMDKARGVQAKFPSIAFKFNVQYEQQEKSKE